MLCIKPFFSSSIQMEIVYANKSPLPYYKNSPPEEIREIAFH